MIEERAGMYGMHMQVTSTRAEQLRDIMSRDTSDGIFHESPKRPKPALLTTNNISGLSDSMSWRSLSTPEDSDRSASMILQGVCKDSDRASMRSALLAIIHMESSPSLSRAWQNSSPMPEEAPVTMAILIARRDRPQQL